MEKKNRTWKIFTCNFGERYNTQFKIHNNFSCSKHTGTNITSQKDAMSPMVGLASHRLPLPAEGFKQRLRSQKKTIWFVKGIPLLILFTQVAGRTVGV